jgi:hypothetical protein
MYSVSRYLVSPIVDLPKGKTTTKLQVGCPIRRSLDQSLFPAPQSLSQGITSFIASCCQGIHQTPFSRLIRSRDGQAFRAAPRAPRVKGPFAKPFASSQRGLAARVPGRKSYIFPPHDRVRPWNIRLVYLTWNKTAVGQAIRPPQVTPTLGRTSGSDVSLSSRLSNAVRIGRNNALTRCPVRSVVEPVGIEPTTPCLQSRCSPS